jgi:hypothetical protein
MTNFTPPSPLATPVLFLVFNRPETTARVFEAIRQARPPRLYVGADGARDEREGEAERTAEVRRIATAVDWPCEVKTLFRDRNLGCRNAVSGAIDWFFENEEAGIILEDDCLPSQSFFGFARRCWNGIDMIRAYGKSRALSSSRMLLRPRMRTIFTADTAQSGAGHLGAERGVRTTMWICAIGRGCAKPRP